MSDSSPEFINLARWIFSILVPAIAGLVGVLVGAWLAGKQQREQQKLAFIEDQLKYFYSPLLGIRNEIRMLSELRSKIGKSAEIHREKRCDEAREQGPLSKAIDYNDRQLTEHLFPLYSKMISIFRDHYYLAEFQTLELFRPLLEFVDIWNRRMDKSISIEVVMDLGIGKEHFDALYEDLEKTHDTLRNKIKTGKA